MAAKKFLRLVSGAITEIFGVQSSAGAGNAGDIVSLDDNGRIDPSMMPVGIAAPTAAITASEALADGDFVNVWNNSGTANPATGTGGVTLTQFGAGKALYPAFGPWGTNDKMTANFGQNAFTGVVPSGFTQGFGTGLPIAGGGVTQSRVMILG